MKQIIILLLLILFSCKKAEVETTVPVYRIVKHSDSLKTTIDKEYIFTGTFYDLYSDEECQSRVGDVKFADTITIIDSLMGHSFGAYQIRKKSDKQTGWLKEIKSAQSNYVLEAPKLPLSETGIRAIANTNYTKNNTELFTRGDVLLLLEEADRWSTVISPTRPTPFRVPSKTISTDPSALQFIEEFQDILNESTDLREDMLELCKKQNYSQLEIAQELKEKLLLTSSSKEELTYAFLTALTDEKIDIPNSIPLDIFSEISDPAFREFVEIKNYEKVYQLLSGVEFVSKYNPRKGNITYNPMLLKWMSENLIPSPDVTNANGVTTQKLYNKYLRNPARILAITLQELYKLDIAKETLSYSASADQYENPDPVRFLIQRYTDGNRALLTNEEERFKELNTMTTTYGFGFWIRRTLDGTISELAQFLYNILKSYDTQWYSEQTNFPGIDELQFIETTDFTKGDYEIPLYYKHEEKLKGLENNIFARAWLNIPSIPYIEESKESYSELRYFCTYAFSILPYKKIAKASGVDIFLKGPHTNDSLDLYSNEFSYYNPEFVKWLTAHAVPATQNRVFRKLTQRYYDKYIKKSAMLYFEAYNQGFHIGDYGSDYNLNRYMKDIEENGYVSEANFVRYCNVLNPHYSEYEGEGDIDGDYSREEATEEEEAQEYILGYATMFWMRRSIDGTIGLFYDLLYELVTTYE